MQKSKLILVLLIISLLVLNLCSCTPPEYAKLSDLIKENGKTNEETSYYKLDISDTVYLYIYEDNPECIQLCVNADFSKIGLDNYDFTLYLEDNDDNTFQWTLRTWDYSSYYSASYGYKAEGYLNPEKITASIDKMNVYDFSFHVNFDYETSYDYNKKEEFSKVSAICLKAGLTALSNFLEENNFKYSLSDYGFKNFK